MLRIEPFDPSAADGVAALCAAEGWPSFTSETVTSALSAPGVIALTASDEHELVGVAELLTDGAVVVYLGLLVVARHARRQGVARSLVAELFVRCDLFPNRSALRGRCHSLLRIAAP